MQIRTDKSCYTVSSDSDGTKGNTSVNSMFKWWNVLGSTILVAWKVYQGKTNKAVLRSLICCHWYDNVAFKMLSGNCTMGHMFHVLRMNTQIVIVLTGRQSVSEQTIYELFYMWAMLHFWNY